MDEILVDYFFFRKLIVTILGPCIEMEVLGVKVLVRWDGELELGF
jgi:hypothetical protein